MSSDEKIDISARIILFMVIIVLLAGLLIIDSRIDTLEEITKQMYELELKSVKTQVWHLEKTKEMAEFLSEYADAKHLEWEEIWVDSGGQ